MALWGKKPETNFADHLEDSIDDPPMAQRLELLEIEIALLKKQLKETQNKLEMFERIVYRTEERPISPKASENAGVYEAFDQGKSLVEIAKQFNKGKGEIELILNLRNLK